MKFISLHPPVPSIRSARAKLVAHWFGIRQPKSLSSAAPQRCHLAPLLPQPGKITLIVGGSGSGKSSLMREMRASAPDVHWIDLDDAALPEQPLVDCFPETRVHETMRHLSAVGLAEVWTWLRTPSELSDGQRWRLHLALALKRGEGAPRPILVCDEFTAVLDRIAAHVVARTLRRSIVAPLAALVATSHEDILAALKPDVVVRCDFGTISIAHVSRE